MKSTCCVIVMLLLGGTAFASDLPLVPMPTEWSVVESANMKLPNVITVSKPERPAWVRHLEIFSGHVQRMTNGQHSVAFSSDIDPTLEIRHAENLAAESYSLNINAKQIQLAASSLKGLSHGTATLMQLLGGFAGQPIPQLSIKDTPRNTYRNFMIDMGRNPHSAQLLKETVDLLWFYKIDSMQLHLTDDQRFAFPSTAYPKLWDGIITVDQFKEIEAYAVARGVTIIPELEVPGHSGKLRGIYPEVFGKVPEDLTKPDALKGIKTLLDEMMDVFSSTSYINIGGDEAFGVPEQAQRDLINTLQAYLKTKGKQTLVWEGPGSSKGENKVNTEVIHINWRTINYPADRMLKDGYRVVNAAWDPLYLVDHYPRTNFTMTSPQHLYETLSLTQFKHVNPGISTFAEPIEVQQTDRLIGYCMPWWEGREENFFPQNVPRLIPFAEVAWDSSILRDFTEFSERQEKTESARLAAFYPVTILAPDLVIPQDGVFHNKTDVTFDSEADAVIRFTLDGSAPSASSKAYKTPIPLTKNTTVRAAAFVDGEQVGHGSRRNFTAVVPTDNLALGKPVKSSVSAGSPFSVQRITDGGTGKLDFYLGYPATPEPLSLTIDLEETQSVSSVTVVAYTVSGSYEKYTIATSVDGKTFDEVASRLEKPPKPTPTVTHEFTKRDVRFVRLRSHGNKGYVFDSFSKVIEVQVR